jgi:hypothetical protein
MFELMLSLFLKYSTKLSQMYDMCVRYNESLKPHLGTITVDVKHPTFMEHTSMVAIKIVLSM